jgi:phospholipid/cholesterol/gamma-HCH transport system substrate-binding protein
MQISNEAKVGILTILAICLLIFGYNFLKGQKVFSRNNTYYVIYQRVDGLLESNPILLNGYQVGSVTRISMSADTSNRVLVQLDIKKDIKIPKNSLVSVTSSGLLGDKALSLEMWKPKTNEERGKLSFYQSGDTIKGKEEVSLLNMASEQIEPLKNKADSIMSKLDSTLTTLNALLASSQVKGIVNNLEKSTATLNTTLLHADKLVGNINAFTETDLKKIGGIMNNVNDITATLKSSTGKVGTIMDKVDKTVVNAEKATNKLAAIDLEQTTQKLNGTLNEVNALISKVNKSDGNLNMLIEDKKLYSNLEQISTNINNLLLDFKENPKEYVGFSLININKKKKEEKK